MIYIPKRTIRANFNPDFPVDVNWANGITKDLCFLVVGGIPIDLVSGQYATTYSNNTQTITPEGRAIVANGTTRTAEWSFNPVVGSGGNGSGEVTLYSRCNPVSGATYGVMIGVMVDPQTSPYQQIQMVANFDGGSGAQSNGIFTIETYNGTNQGYANSNSTAIDGNYHDFIGVYGPVNGGQPVTYIDGIFTSSGSANYTGNFGITSASKISIGSESGNTSSRFLAANIQISAAWNRALSATEILSLHQNRNQLIRPKQRTLFFPVASSGGVALASTATANVTSAASLSVAVPISSASIATSTGSGTLSQAIALASTATATATSSGNLQLSIPLQSSGTATGTGTGSLSLSIALSSSAIATAVSSGALTISGALSGSGTAASTGTGTLTQEIALSSASLAISSGTGNLINLVPLTGASVVNASGSGVLALQIPLSSEVIAQATGAASMSLIVQLNGASVANAVSSGTLALSGQYVQNPRFTIRDNRRRFYIS